MGKKSGKAKNKNSEEELFESDEYHFYIAGYTSGGFSYGITWEQAEEEGLLDEKYSKKELDEDVPKMETDKTWDDDLPF